MMLDAMKLQDLVIAACSLCLGFLVTDFLLEE
jgi:hypothetical protein